MKQVVRLWTSSEFQYNDYDNYYQNSNVGSRLSF